MLKKFGIGVQGIEADKDEEDSRHEGFNKDLTAEILPSLGGLSYSHLRPRRFVLFRVQ